MKKDNKMKLVTFQLSKKRKSLTLCLIPQIGSALTERKKKKNILSGVKMTKYIHNLIRNQITTNIKYKSIFLNSILLHLS